MASAPELQVTLTLEEIGALCEACGFAQSEGVDNHFPGSNEYYEEDDGNPLHTAWDKLCKLLPKLPERDGSSRPIIREVLAAADGGVFGGTFQVMEYGPKKG